MRFDSKIAAGVAASLGLIYMVASLALHHSAKAEIPPDLGANANDAGLDVWRAAAALVNHPGAVLLDVRPAEEYRAWHAAGSISEPGADAARVRDLLAGHPLLVVLAGKDDVARKLVGAARTSPDDLRVFYLVDGPRAWYLALELPVPIFAETPSPPGYDEALAQVRAYFAHPDPAHQAQIIDALGNLARWSYQPSLLKKASKAKATSGAKKKISGGCG